MLVRFFSKLWYLFALFENMASKYKYTFFLFNKILFLLAL